MNVMDERETQKKTKAERKKEVTQATVKGLELNDFVVRLS